MILDISNPECDIEKSFISFKEWYIKHFVIKEFDNKYQTNNAQIGLWCKEEKYFIHESQILDLLIIWEKLDYIGCEREREGNILIF